MIAVQKGEVTVRVLRREAEEDASVSSGRQAINCGPCHSRKIKIKRCIIPFCLTASQSDEWDVSSPQIIDAWVVPLDI